MNILGISCFYHDAAAALIKDGLLIAAAEEERFSRKKHDQEFPVNAIAFCLKKGGLTPADLDYVVFYEKPFLKFERLLMTTFQGFPRTMGLFRESMVSWLLDKLWVKGTIKDKVGIDPKRILFSEHHISHAASAYFCSPFQEAAIFTADAVGEWTTTTVGYARGNELNLEKEVRFPHSLGLLYSAFTAFLGFEVNEGEYKVMGMAPYGQPKYTDKVWKLINVAQDGSFRLDMDYFSYHHSLTRAFNGQFESLFGRPRHPKDSHIMDPYYSDIAASIQVVLEEVILKIVNDLHRRTGLTRLCMAGGVALNSVVNGRILRETPFQELYVQPAAGDGGGAVGAAFYAYHCLLNQPRKFLMHHAYWGQDYSLGEVREVLDSSALKYSYYDDEEKLLDRVVNFIAEGKVVGLSQGAFEFGPRALGNRSILADPRRAEMKEIVNSKIKFREPFRPFAPSVLLERSEDYFVLPEPERQLPARFMLLVTPVKESQKGEIPAVTHVDGSARLQTVTRDTNPRYHRLIQKFGEATGVPVVLNTSFNLRGEPIVNSPADAISTFQRSGMDMLVMENFVVTKENT